MSGKPCAIIVICVLLFAADARGKGEHLEPEPSFFTGIPDYSDKYHRALLKVFGLDPAWKNEVWRGPQAAVIVAPALTTEYRIGLRADEGRYTVSYAIPEMMVWIWLRRKETRDDFTANPDKPVGRMSKEESARYKKAFLAETAGLPERLEDIEVERCEREIGEPLAGKLFQVWYIMLRQVRYNDDQLTGFDGVDYHFTLHTASHVWGMGGQAWSPPKDSDAGRLVAIAETMRRYCLEGGGETAGLLAQQADDLLKRLEG